jgi:hypothetical protein
VGAKRPDLRNGSDEQRKEPRKPESITDPTANCRSPNGNRRQTMATAVYGHATRATPNEFSGFPKIKPAAGQSPLISVSQLFMTERGGPAQQGGGRL